MEVLRKSELRVAWSSWAWRHDVLSFLQEGGHEGRYEGDRIGMDWGCFVFASFEMALNFDRSFETINCR